jgi:hypothetical protein
VRGKLLFGEKPWMSENLAVERQEQKRNEGRPEIVQLGGHCDNVLDVQIYGLADLVVRPELRRHDVAQPVQFVASADGQQRLDE